MRWSKSCRSLQGSSDMTESSEEDARVDLQSFLDDTINELRHSDETDTAYHKFVK